jgi:hypothetical protein
MSFRDWAGYHLHRDGGSVGAIVLTLIALAVLLFASTLGNYPPAKPGALDCEPLKAAIGVADAAPI